MKLRKILLDEHYRLYWKQGPILPDPYPPDHPRAPCYRCNQLCQGIVNWLEGLFHFLLLPTRRHRTRCLLLIGVLMFTITVLNRNQHPMTFSHSLHSPTAHSSWYRFFAGLLAGAGGSSEHKPIRRQLIQDWVFAPNCEALLRGDDEEVHFTKRMLYREVRDKVMDNEYYENTRSCAEFRAAEGYAPVPLSPEEAAFPIAYLIQSYKNAEQLQRLLKVIYAPQNPYCICSNHDATPDFDRSVRSIANCFRNVYHVSTLRMNRTSKGHALSEVDDIKCARKCVKVLLNADWKYLIKIHGQDYPLATGQYIVGKLRNLERLKIPFISDYSHMHRKQSVKVVLSDDGSNKSETIDLTLWTGSPYFIASNSITRSVINSVLTYKLLPLIEHHEHPEAYYWVTLFLYAMGDANHAAIVAANRHRIELLTQKNLHKKQYCAGITQLLDPCILGVEDLGKLFHSHHHQFFAHAFDLDHDHVAYSCLEQRLADAVGEYTGNLTLTFGDVKLHSERPEIELTFKEKPFDKTPSKHINPETETTGQDKAKDLRKTASEIETEDAMKRRHSKQNPETRIPENENQDNSELDKRDEDKLGISDEKKAAKHVKDNEYYNVQTNTSSETKEQQEAKHLDKKITEIDQSGSEKNDKSNRVPAKDEVVAGMVTSIPFPVTESNDRDQLKHLLDILKASHVSRHKHEPGKLELDTLELDHGVQVYSRGGSQFQIGMKSRTHLQEGVDNAKKDAYKRNDVQVGHNGGGYVASNHNYIAKLDTNIKEPKAMKEDTAVLSSENVTFVSKDRKANVR